MTPLTFLQLLLPRLLKAGKYTKEVLIVGLLIYSLLLTYKCKTTLIKLDSVKANNTSRCLVETRYK